MSEKMNKKEAEEMFKKQLIPLIPEINGRVDYVGRRLSWCAFLDSMIREGKIDSVLSQIPTTANQTKQ